MTDTAINAGLRIALEQIHAALRRHGIEPSGDYGADIERLAVDALRYRELCRQIDDADPVSNEASTIRNIVDDSLNLGSTCMHIHLDDAIAKGHSL